MNTQQAIIIFRRIAVISAIFASIVSILLIITFLQYKVVDPINHPALKSLEQRYQDNQTDDAIAQDIRSLDLLARKAFFTSQWQLKTGGILLLIALVLLIVSLQVIQNLKVKIPVLPDSKNAVDELSLKYFNRKWLIISSIVIFTIGLVLSFQTYSLLNKPFDLAVNSNSIDTVATNDNNSNLTNTQSSDNQIVTSSNVLSVENNIASNTDVPADKVNLSVDTSKNQEQPVKPVQKPQFSWAAMKKNFPSFRGFEGNGIVFHKNIPTSWDGKSGKNIAWKLKLPKPGFSSPIIWENNLYITGADKDTREVYCIDRLTGKIVWTADTKGIEGSPAAAPKVTDDTGWAAPTMVTDGGLLFAIFATGDIICLTMDGKRQWARNLGLPQNHYGHSSSLQLFQNVLLVQYDDRTGGKILGLNKENGTQIWRTDRQVKISWASPIVVNTGSSYEVILSSDPFVASYNPLTGKELWKIECMGAEVGPSPAFGAGLVFAANEYAKLVAIKPGSTPEIVWESDEYLPEVASPVVSGDLLFIATSYGAIACYDAKTGTKHWDKEMSTGFYASPVIAGGNVYYLDMNGVMHIFKVSSEQQLISEPALGEKTVSTPAFMDNVIYIRAKENLYCIGKI